MDIEGIGWLAVAVVVAPYAISYLKGAGESMTLQTKRYIAVGVSVVLGTLAYGAQNGFDTLRFENFEQIITLGGAVWVIGQVVYAKLVGGTWLEVKAAETSAGLLL